MFHLWKTNFKQGIRKEIFLPLLQQQNFLQAKKSNNKSQSRVTSTEQD